MTRLLIAGGATGGHLLPALAVAEAFRAEHPDAELLIVGRTGGMEERLVPEAGFALETVHVRGLDRDRPLRNAALPVVLPAAFARGSRIVARFRPDVVLGVGGYVMAPALYGARRRGVPYVLAVFEAGGLANRLFRSGAAAACLTYERDLPAFATPRTVHTGYPLRPGFVRRTPRVPARRLLVLGGSLGARRINRAVWGALDGLLDRFEDVVHLTGARDGEEGRRRTRPGYRTMAFSGEMPELLAEADLVVCRAGVGTISEVTAVGLPMVVVPGSFGGGHQERNAAEVVRAGAAVRVADDELSPRMLLTTLDGLSLARLRAMAEGSARLGRPDATARIVRVLDEVAASRG